jgi:hypothetical protein
MFVGDAVFFFSLIVEEGLKIGCLYIFLLYLAEIGWLLYSEGFA